MKEDGQQKEILPPAFQIAADVTEEEFRKARSQAILTWVLTGVASLFGFVLSFVGLQLGFFLAQGVLAGAGTYATLYTVLPEGRKMGTMRLKKYQELRRLRKARAKAQVLLDEQKKR